MSLARPMGAEEAREAVSGVQEWLAAMDRRSAAVELAGRGMSLRPIALLLRVSKSTVQRWVAAADDAPPGMVTVHRARSMDGRVRPSRRVDTTERDSAIVRLRVGRRWSMRLIAEDVGCSVGTVHRVLRAAGVR